MASSLQTGVLLVTLSAGLAACDGSRATGPSAPTPPTASLSGVVSAETPDGPMPIEGAHVRLDISTYRYETVTDRDGRYRLTKLSDGRGTVTTTLEGYDADMKSISIDGDVLLDIRIAPRLSYTLSGVVYESTPSGPVPIEGVEVYCDSCGSPVGHTWVYTNTAGFYSLSWAFNGTHPLFVTKAGYEIADPNLRDGYGRITATVRGDTRFDIQLARR